MTYFIPILENIDDFTVNFQRHKMELPHDMATLSEVMNSQRQKGYTEDFDFVNNKFIVKSKQQEYKPEDLNVVQVFRFEGMSNPSDMEVLYVIEAKDGTKGFFIDAYGVYAAQDGQKLAESIKKMTIDEDHSKT